MDPHVRDWGNNVLAAIIIETPQITCKNTINIISFIYVLACGSRRIFRLLFHPPKNRKNREPKKAPAPADYLRCVCRHNNLVFSSYFWAIDNTRDRASCVLAGRHRATVSLEKELEYRHCSPPMHEVTVKQFKLFLSGAIAVDHLRTARSTRF